ncbi:MAG: hypothetical protein ACR2GU_13240 [Rubrobacteraceae bacterium]
MRRLLAQRCPDCAAYFPPVLSSASRGIRSSSAPPL